MTFHALTLTLRSEPGVIDRYKAEHRAVWPAVILGLRRIGITKERIFLKGHRLFLYFEAVDGFDVARDFGKLNSDADCRRWDELMRSLQKPVPEAAPKDWWSEMELVFDLDWWQ